jgi:hypothetical protein
LRHIAPTEPRIAGRGGEKVKMRDHAVHRIDLTAELRHEKRIHHRRRGQPKFDGCFGRDNQLIDSSDNLIGVD